MLSHVISHMLYEALTEGIAALTGLIAMSYKSLPYKAQGSQVRLVVP